jgi:outer membrane protein insertion porin family
MRKFSFLWALAVMVAALGGDRRAWGQAEAAPATPAPEAPAETPPATQGATEGGATAAPADPTANMAEGALQVVRVVFRGNRKVEDDALRVNLRTVPGALLTRDLVRDDIRAIWKMGFFEDVQVEVTTVPTGAVVVFVVKEKPSIRKIYVSGHDEIGLTKVNEVLDIKKEQILDLAKVKKNTEKIREVYVQRGFYMADVEYELRREAPGEVDVYFRVRENGKVEVRRVNFVGNAAASDAELRAVMLTQPGDLLSFVTSAGTYREDVFQRDILLLQSWYWDRGYINVKIAEPQMELSADKRNLYITLSVDEGKQYRIGDIDVKGDLLEGKEAYLRKLRVKKGEIFNRSRLTQDMQELTENYQDQGFANANAVPETRLDEKNRIVHLTFDIQKGNKVYIERIVVRGNTKTRDKVIRREMRIVEGETYSKTKIETSKDRVTRLGFFERVDLSTKRGSSDDQMEINVEVSERQTGSFQIGAGFSSVESFIAQAQISQNNLFGRGQLLTLQAQISGLRQLFLLQFEDPYFLDTNWTFGFNLFNQQRYYLSFTRRSVGGSLTWGYMLTDDVRTFLTYTLQDVSVSTSGRSNLFSGGQRSPIPEGSLANLLRSGLTSSARVSVSHDTRDNRLFTTRGWYNTASAEFAEPALASENQFSRYDATARYFHPIWGPFVLRLKGDVGLVTSRDPQGVPIYERYFVGGIYDVRGFQPYSLGPLIRVPQGQSPDASLNTFRIGGNMQVVGKAEIEVPVFEKVGIRAVVFTDVGNAYNLENQYCRLKPAGVHASQDPCVNFPSIDSLRASWGLGFRWFSPIGPLRFEWGFPFKTLPGEEPAIFEFTIGNEL